MVISSSPHFSLKQLFAQKSFSNSLSKQYGRFKVELSHLALKMIQQSLSFSFVNGFDSIPKEAANKEYKNEEAEKNKRKGVGAKVILLLAIAAK